MEKSNESDAILAEYADAIADGKDAVRHGIRCGQLLIKQRAKMEYEVEFMAWVTLNCQFSYPKAMEYMKLARSKNAKKLIHD